MYFQLVPSTLPTEGIGFGLLLKTPSAMDSYSENLTKKEQKFGNSGTLAQEVQSGFIYQRGLLPTPTAMDSTNATATMKMSMGMLPTPTTHDAKHSTTKSPSWERRIEQNHLAETVLNPYIQEVGGSPSQLNPLFVLEMMGFPPNWTELPFLNGETNQSKQPGTL
jgi:hypothetical protein